MVFVIAALYSLYRSRENQKHAANNTNTENINTEAQVVDAPTHQPETQPRRDETAANRNHSSNKNQASFQIQKLGQDLSDQLQKTGSALTSVLRCTTTNTTAGVVNDDDDDKEWTPAAAATTAMTNSSRSASEMSMPASTVQAPPDAIKQDWIDACFGSNFPTSLDMTTTRRSTNRGSVGTISTSTTFAIPTVCMLQGDVDIEDETTTSSSRVGLTLGRLALGVYVQSVQVGSEAAMAGILPESILVAINDLPVLAEPTQQLLERLWQYEGIFTSRSRGDEDNVDEDDNNNDVDNDILQRINPETHVNSSTATAANTNKNWGVRNHADSALDGVAREPVIFVLIRASQIYTAILLSTSSTNANSGGGGAGWGIQWAPAAVNLPTIQRVGGIAATAGLLPHRGSLVAAVNGKSLREMDHVATARRMRDIFANDTDSDLKDAVSGESPSTKMPRECLCVTTVFPPSNARTSHYERSSLPAGERRMGYHHHAAKKDQVVAKPIGQFDGVEVKLLPLGYAITSLCASEKNVLTEEKVTEQEQTVEELAVDVAALRVVAPSSSFSMSRRRVIPPQLPKFAPCPSPRPEQLLNAWDPLQSLFFCLQFQQCAIDDSDFCQTLQLGYDDATKHQRRSSMHLISEILSSPAGADVASAFLLQLISLICAPGQCGDLTLVDGKPLNDDETMTQGANALTSILLKLSRKNESFCQRLYFLLRSYISTFETSRPAPDGDSRNLTALLNCLELLRFAERELGGRSSVSTSLVATSATRSRLSPIQYELDINDVPSFIQGIGPSSVPAPIPASPDSPPSEDGGDSPKKKRLINLIKKSPLRRKRTEKATTRRRLIPDPPQAENYAISECVDSTSLQQCPSSMYESMSDFLSELDKICATIERTFQKSFRQKIADWAMQPWSAGKDATLEAVTADMRKSLESAALCKMLLVNPVESAELLSSLDYNECYILPSAHFPILLTFNVSERRCSDSIVGEERLYRTRVELVSLTSPSALSNPSFNVEGSFAGSIAQSGASSPLSGATSKHVWAQENVLILESRSSWGAPETLSLRLFGKQITGDCSNGSNHSGVGFCWLDLSDEWKRGEASSFRSTKRFIVDVWPICSMASRFDEHGELPGRVAEAFGSLEVRVTTESIEFEDEDEESSHCHGFQHRKRMLLYKHDDDLRQEAFAIQFINTCSFILTSLGLDMKLLTFQCIPVGTKRGFVEWVPGSVTLSEICDPFNSLLSNKALGEGRESPPHTFMPGMNKYGSLRRLRGRHIESMFPFERGRKAGARGSISNDPIQDYLRSVAFDPTAPYLIRRDVMDNYVKSCAGYSVVTYILGVGDRHLDNLLLHHTGKFFHCDFSFILGSDPKTYLPMRITEDMVYGMGGRESDNYARFLSLTSACFLALRRPENVRILLSMIRLMAPSCLPDVSKNQTIDQAIFGVRDRLRLDLSECHAISFMENLVKASLSNKLWIAVDAIHKLGKRF